MRWVVLSRVKRQGLFFLLGAALGVSLVEPLPLTAASASLAVQSKRAQESSRPSRQARKHRVAAKKKPGRKSRRARRSALRTQRAPTPERIKEIQSALARAGYHPGKATGKWDATTSDAMRSFQEAKGLTSTGKIDAPSLQKLGLGSDTAGVAAPRPAPQPTPPHQSPGP